MQDVRRCNQALRIFWDKTLPKAFDVKLPNKEGKLDYVWATSWGVSTRLMGALLWPIQMIMASFYLQN